ncbi:MAG: hypothetical protein WAO19_13730 [Candidatus Kryptoniota bacterium]
MRNTGRCLIVSVGGVSRLYASFAIKSKRERIIPDNKKLLDVLMKIRAVNNNGSTSNYVFQRKGKKLNGNNLSRVFKMSMRTAGLDAMLDALSKLD